MDGLRGRDPGHIERPVPCSEVTGALQHLGRAAGVLVGVDEDGAVRVIAEELERARLEGRRVDVVTVGLVVQPHAQDSRGQGPCHARLQVLGGRLSSKGECVAALDVLARVHGRANIEGAPRVLEPYVIVRIARYRIHRLRAHRGPAGTGVVNLDDIVATGAQVGVHLAV